MVLGLLSLSLLEEAEGDVAQNAEDGQEDQLVEASDGGRGHGGGPGALRIGWDWACSEWANLGM